MVLEFLEIYHDKRQMNTYKLETIQISSKGKIVNILSYFSGTGKEVERFGDN